MMSPSRQKVGISACLKMRMFQHLLQGDLFQFHKLPPQVEWLAGLTAPWTGGNVVGHHTYLYDYRHHFFWPSETNRNLLCYAAMLNFACSRSFWLKMWKGWPRIGPLLGWEGLSDESHYTCKGWALESKQKTIWWNSPKLFQAFLELFFLRWSQRIFGFAVDKNPVYVDSMHQ